MAPPGAPPPSRWRRLSLLLALSALVAVTPAWATDELGVTASVRVSPITVALDLSASTVRVGQAVTARVIAINVSSQTVRSVTLGLRFERAGLALRGATSSRLTQLKAGRAGEVSFKLCGAAVGSYLVLAQADVGGSTIESPARLLVVTDGRHTKC